MVTILVNSAEGLSRQRLGSLFSKEYRFGAPGYRKIRSHFWMAKAGPEHLRLGLGDCEMSPPT